MVLLNSKRTHKRGNGFVMIDVIVGVAVSAVILVSFTGLLYHVIRINTHNLTSLKATLYLNEMAEVARELEVSKKWSELTAGGCTITSPCHPEVQSGDWVIMSGSEVLDNYFTRSFYIEDVYRDSDTFPNTIVPTPDFYDPDTKKVTVRVSWESSFGPKNVQLEMYVYKF